MLSRLATYGALRRWYERFTSAARPLLRHRLPGARALDPTRPTILVAVHEASRTGAPIVGAALAAGLAERHNVIVVSGKSGPLIAEFQKHSHRVFVFAFGGPIDAESELRELKARYRVDAVLVNSAESDVFTRAALSLDIPSVALVHEFPECILPRGRLCELVAGSDRVVVPAALLEREVQDQLVADGGHTANNVLVRSQGKIPSLSRDDESGELTHDELLQFLRIERPERTRLVLGAGSVIPRKGVELFVQAAALVRDSPGSDVRFCWVGARDDPAYSRMLDNLVRRLAVEDVVFFLPYQSSLRTLFEVARVFFLCSTLDPFPNVVVDALCAGRRVVCFDRTTGVASYIQSKSELGVVAGYGDVGEAARAITELLELRPIPDDVRGELERDFDWNGYVGFIEEQIVEAKLARQRLVEVVGRIAEGGWFDARFFAGADAAPSDVPRSLRRYAASGMKGLLGHSPRPGFNEGRFWNSDPGALARGAVGLEAASALHSASPPATHRCVILDDSPKPASRLAVGIHVHLHYEELAAEFLARLRALQCAADLVVTTTSNDKRERLRRIFGTYEFGDVCVVDVPNRGKDIAPFLRVALPSLGRNYDVIGHFHGKRSLAAGVRIGERWRKYLLDVLLGSRDGVRRILELFESEPQLGLAFAEDHHPLRWDANKAMAEDLVRRMSPAWAPPTFPVFPLGTMFWARPSALEPLVALGLTTMDFPVEPAANDGTIMHAIERLLPTSCEISGHSWCTVYRSGLWW